MTVLVPVRAHSGIVGYALVDEIDAELVQARRWNRLPSGYVMSGERGVSHATCYLHRLLLGLPYGDLRQGDHINGDKLDNRRSNLRIVTTAQNNQNKPSVAGSSSRFRGVSFERARSKWRAQATVSGQRHYLGLYVDELEAARVAARFRAEHMTHTVEDPALLGEAA